ncbi:hypothetical protein EHP00_1914 [Ecytonucleospora hepatopenaei]|uniref:Uncharacterized protein n=1 Tax=Ecytonucleospora hepatopenaei TaxID=646526 RepID=A0A1W0E5A5_9MICR|nr:hypothetical protein EHP00_1914 [Ecytonucleospora hepatopenaei]
MNILLYILFTFTFMQFEMEPEKLSIKFKEKAKRERVTNCNIFRQSSDVEEPPVSARSDEFYNNKDYDHNDENDCNYSDCECYKSKINKNLKRKNSKKFKRNRLDLKECLHKNKLNLHKNNKDNCTLITKVYANEITIKYVCDSSTSSFVLPVVDDAIYTMNCRITNKQNGNNLESTYKESVKSMINIKNKQKKGRKKIRCKNTKNIHKKKYYKKLESTETISSSFDGNNFSNNGNSHNLENKKNKNSGNCQNYNDPISILEDEFIKEGDVFLNENKNDVFYDQNDFILEGESKCKNVVNNLNNDQKTFEEMNGMINKEKFFNEFKLDSNINTTLQENKVNDKIQNNVTNYNYNSNNVRNDPKRVKSHEEIMEMCNQFFTNMRNYKINNTPNSMNVNDNPSVNNNVADNNPSVNNNVADNNPSANTLTANKPNNNITDNNHNIYKNDINPQVNDKIVKNHNIPYNTDQNSYNTFNNITRASDGSIIIKYTPVDD